MDLSGERLGEYVLGERLAEGGNGAVYTARQRSLDRDVVIKVMLAPTKPDTVERFHREAQIAARLDHPYAAHIYDFGARADGQLWIAMERVNGRTLEELLDAHPGRAMSLDVFTPLLERLARVVHAAHAAGIVHRDLKPSNVMVTERAGELLPKLLDFGFAAVRAELAPPIDPDAPVPRKLTPRSRTFGSPSYMAPEQWRCSEVGPAADLYALGVIAFEALTGTVPFRGENMSELATQHCTAPVPRLPIGLARFFERALAKHPEQRFASALDLAAALRAEAEANLLARLRDAAARWDRAGRPRGMLWRDDIHQELSRWLDRSARADAMGPVEIQFVDASQSLADAEADGHRRRVAWVRRGAVLTGLGIAGVVIGALHYEAKAAKELAAATATDAEVEQGRAALLHDELADARQHLSAAWARGDRSSATRFMLSKATEPERAEQARFPATGRVWSASWSPDGRRAVVADDHAAQIWDTEANRAVGAVQHDDTVYAATFAGHWVVTASGDGHVRIARAADGAPVRELTRPHRLGTPLRYYQLAVSGETVAAVDTAGATVDVWSTSGALLAELDISPGRGWPALAFSPDGRWLAVTGGDTAQVHDTSDWSHHVTLPGAGVRALAWSGDRLLTGATTGAAEVWSADGTRLAHLRDVGDAVDAVAWSSDDRLAAVATRRGDVQVFSAAGQPAASAAALHGKISTVEFSPDGSRIVAAGAGVAVIEAATGLPTALWNPGGAVMAAHFSSDSRRVLGAVRDGSARIWDATATHLQWRTPAMTDDCGVVASAVSDGRFVAVPCGARPVRVWDTVNGRMVAELPASTALPVVSGDRVAAGHGDTAEIYDLRSGAALRAIQHAAAVTAVAVGADNSLISGDASGGIMVDGVVMPHGVSAVDAIAALPSGFAVADAGHHLRAFPAQTVLPMGTRASLLRPSPDGLRLVVVPAATASEPPELWDLTTGRAVALTGHTGRVFSARWDRDRLLTMGSDGSIRMWDSLGNPLAVFRAPVAVFDAALSPDGQWLLGGLGEGKIRMWDTGTGRPVWGTTAHTAAVVGVQWDGEAIVTRGFGGDVARWASMVRP